MRLCNFIVRGYLFSHLCASARIQSMHTWVGPSLSNPILSFLLLPFCLILFRTLVPTALISRPNRPHYPLITGEVT